MFDRCKKWWHYPLVVLSTLGFYVLFPVWYLCSLYWWKENSAFVMLNIELVAKEPWNIDVNFK